MADHGEIRVSGAWETADAFHGRVAGAWEECDECWARISGAWKLFHSGAEDPCSTIDNALSNTYSERGCAAPKCRTCVAWDLGCDCIAGQVIDIFRSDSGGSYVLVGNNISCTNAGGCDVPPGGPWTGSWLSTICATIFRQHRVELMDTDTTTTLDTAFTANENCAEA